MKIKTSPELRKILERGDRNLRLVLSQDSVNDAGVPPNTGGGHPTSPGADAPGDRPREVLADYGVDGIQNVLANTLREAAAAAETVPSNGHDNNSLDEIALRQNATLPALPALPAPHIQPDQSITGTWVEPDWTILDDRRGELPGFPTDTFSPSWQDWLQRTARGAGATVGHVAVPLLAIASSLIGTARRVRASSSWSEPCTMWTAVVGFSGTGKTPGIDVTKRALVHIEKERKHKIAELQRHHESQVEIAKAENRNGGRRSRRRSKMDRSRHRCQALRRFPAHLSPRAFIFPQ
jgi:hypothetical protein